MPGQNVIIPEQTANVMSGDAFMFDMAPVALWLEDYSALRLKFEAFRSAGILSISDYIDHSPEIIWDLIPLIKTIKVNRKTLTLFEARHVHDIGRALASDPKPEAKRGFIETFIQLWNGALEFNSQCTAQTCRGNRIDFHVRGIVLPGYEKCWSRVMIAFEDLTEREAARRQLVMAENYARSLFDHSPVSIWLEDGRALLALFNRWRAEGVTSYHAHIRANPTALIEMLSSIRVVEVNRKTLSLFEAHSMDELVANLPQVFGEYAARDLSDTFEDLWHGKTEFSCSTINFTLTGRPLHVQIWGRLLPGFEQSWERFLLVIEDVSEREAAHRQASLSEAFSRRLFEHSSVALWVEDFSGVKAIFDDLRARGVTDLEAEMRANPDLVFDCIKAVRAIDVNHRAVELYKAADKATLLANVTTIIGKAGIDDFLIHLQALWRGQLSLQKEVFNVALDGSILNLHFQFLIFPGHEEDWSLAQIALIDITARKSAEAKVEFMGRHDVLTKLHNRSFYVESLQRIERDGPNPVTAVVIDLNGLKAANDHWGHAAGDALLQRMGSVLIEATQPRWQAARIGGDEFVILMPGGDADMGKALVDQLEELVALDNRTHPDLTLSLSIGVATQIPGESLSALVNRADGLMYDAKRRYYAAQSQDRRRNVAQVASR